MMPIWYMQSSVGMTWSLPSSPDWDPQLGSQSQWAPSKTIWWHRDLKVQNISGEIYIYIYLSIYIYIYTHLYIYINPLGHWMPLAYFSNLRGGVHQTMDWRKSCEIYRKQWVYHGLTIKYRGSGPSSHIIQFCESDITFWDKTLELPQGNDDIANIDVHVGWSGHG